VRLLKKLPHFFEGKELRLKKKKCGSLFISKIFFSIPALFVISFLIFQTKVYSQQVDNKSNYNIDNCVNVFNPQKIDSTKTGYQYWFVNKDFIDGRTLKLSVVAPHSATHPPHIHPEDEFFFIVEGKAEFFLAGKTKIVEGLATFYCPSNIEHGIRNIGDKELKYLVIKKYEKKK
jgi:mannose-6-phosphate isomerase-like protein (cupin superfamily)